jgi:hypothetical protein
MKASMILAVLTGALLVTGCGDGNSTSPTASLGTADASAQQNAQSPALPSAPPTDNASADTSNAASAPEIADPRAVNATQNSPIDPPSPPVSMSAGVTETIDPPRPASALAQDIAPTNNDTSSVASEQLTPVVHYPLEPAAGSSN